MNLLFLFIIAIFVGLFSTCQGAIYKVEKDEKRLEYDDKELKLDHSFLNVQIDSIIAKNSGCFDNFDEESNECEWMKIKFFPAQPTKESLGQRILIIEETVPDSSLLRYRNKVLGFYKYSKADQQILEWQPEASISKLTYDLHYEYLGNLDLHIPTSDFDIYGTELLKTIQLDSFNYDIGLNGHGSLGFNLLADLNPNAQFLFAQLPKFSDKICNIDHENTLAEIENDLHHSLIHMTKLIQKYKISFINIVTSQDHEWYEKFLSSCNKYDTKNLRKGAVIYSNLFREYYSKLSQIEGVLIFKSASNNYEQNSNKANFLSDYNCFDSSKIFSVGYLTIKDPMFGKKGKKINKFYLPENQRGGSDCVEIYINSGYSEGPDNFYNTPDISPGKNPLTLNGQGGVARYIENMMATSWATPLALSMFNYFRIQNQNYFNSDADLLKISEQLRGRMFDPLYYDQFISPQKPLIRK